MFSYIAILFLLLTVPGSLCAANINDNDKINIRHNGDKLSVDYVKHNIFPNEDLIDIGKEVDVLKTNQSKKSTTYSYIRPLAIKTNLLFDLATILNIEVEVPLASNWSVLAEWSFPWWLWEKKQNCFQLLSGGIEARYWFRPNPIRQDQSLYFHNPLTGWFVGVYGGAGLYDFERGSSKGYQGEFWHAGVTGGYALPLSRNFCMEFSLGFGYLNSRWERYTPRQDSKGDWMLTCHSKGRTIQPFIPTKAKVSLIWYPHIKKRK